MAAYTEDDILGALDDAQSGECWQWLDFEHPDYDILSVRLITYRDGNRWAIVLCTIQWDSDHGIYVMVAPVGNCVQFPQPTNYEALLAECIKEDLEERWESRKEYSREMWHLAGLDKPDSGPEFELEMRERVLSQAEFMARMMNTVAFEYDFGNKALEKKGYVKEVRIRGKKIAPSNLNIKPDSNLGRDGAFWVGMAIMERYRDEIMPTDEELAKFFPEGMPTKFLVLDEWHYSKWGLASEWEVFQLLAKALVKGDATLYQPTEEPNTDWRNRIHK